MPREAIHPDKFLADELQELEMTAAELARLLQVPANRISQILTGKRGITADTALRLGRYFGTGPTIWLNLQQAYDLDVPRQQAGSDIDRLPQREPASTGPSGA